MLLMDSLDHQETRTNPKKRRKTTKTKSDFYLGNGLSPIFILWDLLSFNRAPSSF